MYTHPEHLMRRLFCFRHFMIAKNPALACTTWTLGLLYSTHSICLGAAFFGAPLSQSYSTTGVFSGTCTRLSSEITASKTKRCFKTHFPFWETSISSFSNLRVKYKKNLGFQEWKTGNGTWHDNVWLLRRGGIIPETWKSLENQSNNPLSSTCQADWLEQLTTAQSTKHIFL